MKVIEVLENKGKPTLSFEFFPPKTPKQEEKLFNVLSQLKDFHPDYVSVTYGAMGNTREKSFFWVKEIKNRFKIEPVAHLTCVAASHKEIFHQLEEFKEIGIENLLALRGDPPEGEKDFHPPVNGFHHADDLISFIKEEFPSFCVGAAGYPEGHPQSPSFEKDTEFIKKKIEAGADYIVSQLFFDNQHFFSFLKRCEKSDIAVSIIPGIMPITSFKQVERFTKVCGVTLPKKLLYKLEEAGNDQEATKKIGIEHAIEQCKELLAAKVKGLHFFVMNQAEPVSTILKELNL